MNLTSATLDNIDVILEMRSGKVGIPSNVRNELNLYNNCTGLEER